MQEAKCEYKNCSRKIWVEAYLLSYNQFKLDEARRGQNGKCDRDRDVSFYFHLASSNVKLFIIQ